MYGTGYCTARYCIEVTGKNIELWMNRQPGSDNVLPWSMLCVLAFYYNRATIVLHITVEYSFADVIVSPHDRQR